MNIKPQGLKLIVKVLEKKEAVMESGLIEVATANADLREAEVVAIGEGLVGKINEGDIILYPNGRGVIQRIDGEWYLWLDAEPGLEQVWGVISKEQFKKDKGEGL